jgi:inosose dehydratase
VTEYSRSGVSRRDFLKTTALGAAGIAAGSQPAWASNERPYGPFRVGLQSYSLRAFKVDEALAMTRSLAVPYWEAFQAHVPQVDTKEKAGEILAKFKAANVKLVNWGVQGFDGNEAKSRAVFEFAKAAGIETISADPAPDSFGILDKLVAQYGINIAIHNHGPGARYDKLSSVANALKDRHPRIGACVDTGHTLRSGEDPVVWVQQLGKRVLDLHLKDVKGKTEFTEVGKGDMRTVDLFRELNKLKFKGLVALEYEEHEKEPGGYIDICLAATRDAIEKAINYKS